MKLLQLIKVETGGINGENGVIAITTRPKPLFETPGDDTNIKRMIVNGYDNPKEYFEPKYLITPENPDFSKYATFIGDLKCRNRYKR